MGKNKILKIYCRKFKIDFYHITEKQKDVLSNTLGFLLFSLGYEYRQIWRSILRFFKIRK